MEVFKCACMAVIAILLGVLIFCVVSDLPRECDTCGAKVHDLWPVGNGTSFIYVCEHCVNAIESNE